MSMILNDVFDVCVYILQIIILPLQTLPINVTPLSLNLIFSSMTINLETRLSFDLIMLSCLGHPKGSKTSPIQSSFLRFTLPLRMVG